MPGFNATPNLRMHRRAWSPVTVTVSGFDYCVLSFFKRRN